MTRPTRGGFHETNIIIGLDAKHSPCVSILLARTKNIRYIQVVVPTEYNLQVVELKRNPGGTKYVISSSFKLLLFKFDHIFVD
jgi:hypothetical protein